MTISNRQWGDRDSGGYASWGETRDYEEYERESLEKIIERIDQHKEGLNATIAKTHITQEYVDEEEWDYCPHGNNDSKPYLVPTGERKLVTRTNTEYTPDEKKNKKAEKEINKILRLNREISLKFYVKACLKNKHYPFDEYKKNIDELKKEIKEKGNYSREQEDLDLLIKLTKPTRKNCWRGFCHYYFEYLKSQDVDNLEKTEAKYLYDHISFSNPLKEKLVDKLGYCFLRVWYDKFTEG